MRFSFGCDCTYESRAGFLLTSVREKGAYRAAAGELSFSRASGEITTWPFRFEGERLILEESSDESHAYRRVQQQQCPDTAQPS